MPPLSLWEGICWEAECCLAVLAKPLVGLAKHLAVAGLLLSSRKIVEGIDWVKTLKGKGADVPKLVEKGKAQFVGPEVRGKTLGVIGLGALVAKLREGAGLSAA